MSTMTLEQVRDALRSIEGSKAGAFGGYYLSENAIKTWADAIDAHLREREAAKAVAEVCYDSFGFGRIVWRKECGKGNQPPDGSLLYTAPMLASARVPEAEKALFSAYPAGATHYLPHTMTVRGKTQLTMRWFKKNDRGEWYEWETDSDDEYPAFYLTTPMQLEPFPLLAAAPKRGEG